MRIKEHQLNLAESQKIHDEIVKVKPLQLNQCYLNTFTVACYLMQDRVKSRKYKVAYGYMKVVNDDEKGYQDWQYKTFIRHAFLVDDKNKVIDISFIHLSNIKKEKTPPIYLVMKKFSINEYMKMAMDLLKENPEEIDLVWEHGVIKNEKSFNELARKEGYVLV